MQKGRNNNNSFRSYGEEGRNIQVSTDHSYYDLGCMESPLDLCPSASEEEDDDFTETNKLYNEKFGTIGRKYNVDTTRSRSTLINGQRDIFAISIVGKEKWYDSCQVHQFVVQHQ